MMSDSIKSNIKALLGGRTRFIISQRYKFLSTVAKLLIALVVIAGLIGTVRYYRLSPGWVAPSFKAALTESVGPIEVNIPEAHIGWGGWRHPLGIHIRNVTLKKLDMGITVEIPNLIISIKILPLLWGKAEIGKCLFNSGKIYSKNQLLGIVSAKVKISSQQVAINAAFQQVDVTALAHLAMGEPIPLQIFLPVQGTLSLTGGREIGLVKMNLSCTSAGGLLIIPGIYPESVKLDKINLLLTGTSKTLTLKKAQFNRGAAQLNVHGNLTSLAPWHKAYKEGGKLNLIIEGDGTSIPMDDLNLLWPQGLSPKPRKWVVSNLSKGITTHVTTQMNGTIQLAPNARSLKFEIPQIGGQIDATGVTVKYFGNLPLVTGTEGVCTFTRQNFMIDAAGKVNDVLLKSAKIDIQDLHLADQNIDITLDLEGSVRNSLDIINARPLYLAKKLDLDPSHMTGKAATQVHLAFPLEIDVPLEMVKVQARSKITDGKIIFESKQDDHPVILDQGAFDLEASDQSLSMQGRANLQGISTQIQWQELFKDKKIPFRRRFVLSSLVDFKKLKNFDIDLADYLEGSSPTRIIYTVDSKGNGLIEGDVDLKPAIMVSPILPWQKDKGEPAHLHLTLRKKTLGGTFLLDEAKLVAPKLTMEMTGRESKFGDVYEVKHLKIGNSTLKSTIQRDGAGVFQAIISGKVIDLSHIFDDSTPEPLIKPSSKGGSHDSQIKVKLHLDEVFLGKNNAIHDVNGELLYKANILQWANLKGKPPHKGGSISLHMIPMGSKHQKFTLESDDGGHLLEMLGAGYDLEGGHLLIKGVKSEKYIASSKGSTDRKTKSWEIVGDISIDDFTINQAPLLARLLSAASLQGIVNFFSGRGITFQNGEAEFSLTPENLHLKKARLISFALGLVFNGVIDRLHHKVNFSGELIPLYVANTVLARIPLLGPLMSGGKEDGVFMTQFTLTGNRNDPELAINPITTVTPGMVRELFTPHETKN